jgi:hypothetical protein
MVTIVIMNISISTSITIIVIIIIIPSLSCWPSWTPGDLIPHEDKWKLINHPTYLFRVDGGGDPLWMKISGS